MLTKEESKSLAIYTRSIKGYSEHLFQCALRMRKENCGKGWYGSLELEQAIIRVLEEEECRRFLDAET